MGKINDLSQGNLGDLARQQHRDQYATPLNGSSVGHGGQRFYGTGKLTVENEGLYVTGVASIAGTLTVAGTSRFSGQTFIYGPLEVTGDVNLDGTTDVTGALNVTGPTKLNGKTDIGGATKITGTLDVTSKTTLGGDTTVSGKLDVTGAMATKGTLSVEGVTTLKNDLNVTTGGKISAGSVSIDPGYLSGAVRFSNGSYLASTPNGAQVVSGAGALVASNAQASIGFTGGGSVIAHAGGVNMNGIPTTTQEANLYMDSSGKIFRKS